MEFQLKSAAFQANGRIPDRHTCTADDVPPPLAWSGAPATTKSFALIVDDPDAPGGTFHHWAICDIAAAATTLDAGRAPGAHEAINDFGRVGYGGPCPPPGRPHHYRFRLLALDVERLDLPHQPKSRDVERKAERHRLAEATLVGTYSR